jgi:hypothetical protein
MLSGQRERSKLEWLCIRKRKDLMSLRVISNWDEIEFADSIVKSWVQHDNCLDIKLSHVSISGAHPVSDADSWKTYKNCRLVFSNVSDFEAISYDSNTDSETRIVDPYIDIYVIMKVKQQGSNWTLSGWLREGPWVDIKLKSEYAELVAGR